MKVQLPSSQVISALLLMQKLRSSVLAVFWSMAEGASAGAEAIWESGEFRDSKAAGESKLQRQQPKCRLSRRPRFLRLQRSLRRRFCRKSKVFWIQEAAAGVDFLDGHFVLGEGAGLVGTDDVDAADGFAGDHLFDQSVFAGHFDDVEGEGDGDDGGQAFRHGGHDEDDAGDEGF